MHYRHSDPLLSRYSSLHPEGSSPAGFLKTGRDPVFPRSPYSILGRCSWSIYILNKYFLKPKAPV